MKFISNNQSIVFFLNTGNVKVDKSSPLYLEVRKVFDLPESQQDQALMEVLSGQSETKKLEKEGVVITGDKVTYKGEDLPKALADKIISIAKEGLPISLFGRFWENLRKNPSSSSVAELYDFLAVKELPITEDGCFLAYRGLRSNYYSRNGNTSTKVLKGTVNGQGQIYNGVGEEIEVERNNVDDNRNFGCSHGLHVGSLSYAKGWSQGQLVVVKVNPKDVVSVPTENSCQKCRVCAYTVVSDFKEEILAPVTTRKGVPVENKERKKAQKELSDFTKKVSRYLENAKKKGKTSVKVQSIQNSFSPKYPSKVNVLAALSELGKTWKGDDVRL